MKMKNNKKGIVSMILIGVGVLAIIIFLILAFNASAREATSLTPKAPSCSAPILQAELSGDFVVKDGQVIGVEPEIDRIENIGIRANPLGILEPFNYEVTVTDRSNGVKLDSIQGNSKLDSSQKDVKIPFSLFFKVPDNDCDGKVDRMRLNLNIQIEETEDVFKDTDVFTQDITIKEGRVE